MPVVVCNWYREFSLRLSTGYTHKYRRTQMHTQTVIVPSSRVRLAPDGPIDSAEQHKNQADPLCVWVIYCLLEKTKESPCRKSNKTKTSNLPVMFELCADWLLQLYRITLIVKCHFVIISVLDFRACGKQHMQHKLKEKMRYRIQRYTIKKVSF